MHLQWNRHGVATSKAEPKVNKIQNTSERESSAASIIGDGRAGGRLRGSVIIASLAVAGAGRRGTCSVGLCDGHWGRKELAKSQEERCSDNNKSIPVDCVAAIQWSPHRFPTLRFSSASSCLCFIALFPIRVLSNGI